MIMEFLILGMAFFIFLLMLFIFSYPVSVQWRGPGSWDMGPGMMSWGIGWSGPIIMVIFWIAVIAAIFFLIRWLVRSARESSPLKTEDSAPDILKKRYARGEIDKEEYEEKKKDLSGFMISAISSILYLTRGGLYSLSIGNP
jgi:putative membrane protein